LHIVDCALGETSSSVPHAKQVIRRRSGAGASAARAGCRAARTSKCRPHALQYVEIAARDSGCRCPQ
jgi:hypothetical protein